MQYYFSITNLKKTRRTEYRWTTWMDAQSRDQPNRNRDTRP